MLRLRQRLRLGIPSGPVALSWVRTRGHLRTKQQRWYDLTQSSCQRLLSRWGEWVTDPDYIVQSRKPFCKTQLFFLLALAFLRVCRYVCTSLKWLGCLQNQPGANRNLPRIENEVSWDVLPLSLFHFTTHHILLHWRGDLHTRLSGCVILYSCLMNKPHFSLFSMTLWFTQIFLILYRYSCCLI